MTREKPRRHRILVLEPSGNLWGSENVLLDLLKSVDYSHFDVGICCPPDGPMLGELETLPVRKYPYFVSELHKKGKLTRLKALFGLKRGISQFRPDLIYVNQAGVTRMALIASRFWNIPVVCSVKLVEDIARTQALVNKTTRLHKIIAVSQYIKDGLIAQATIPPDRVSLIYDPYLPIFSRLDAHSHNAPDETRHFVCVGRLAASKGQDIAVRAVAELRDRGIHTEVTFIGDAEAGSTLGDELKQLARELGVESRIHWHRATKDFFTVANGAVAWLCPSRHDPFPRVMLAAVDAGAFPIACRTSGGPSEFIRSSGGGISYEEPTPASLADAMLQTLNMTRAQLFEKYERGRTWIEENCSPANAARETQTVWSETIQKVPSRFYA